MTDHDLTADLITELWDAANHGTGWLATDRYMRHLVRELVRTWNARTERDLMNAGMRDALTVGCPYCDVAAGEPCRRTANGQPYLDRAGGRAAYAHADRRRALAALNPSADVFLALTRPRKDPA